MTRLNAGHLDEIYGRKNSQSQVSGEGDEAAMNWNVYNMLQFVIQVNFTALLFRVGVFLVHGPQVQVEFLSFTVVRQKGVVVVHVRMK